MLEQQTQTDAEAHFGPDEIFYSRTDGRGIIRSGNAVFFRVSGFGVDRLLGAPHRIIRHSDTPKAIFWLVWQMLGKGETVGAYVKNRAANGRYYWVFAVMQPFEDGYVSVRIKPSSDWLARIKPIYADLVAREQGGLSAADSAACFQAMLADLGYPDFTSFLADLIVAECGPRYAGRADWAGRLLPLLPAMRHSLSALANRQRALIDRFDQLQFMQTNMRLVATRIEAAGGPVTAISDSYRDSVGDLLRALRAVSSRDGGLLERMLADAVINTGSLLMQLESLELFARDPAQLVGQDAVAETRMMTDLNHAHEYSARAHLTRISDTVRMLGRNCAELRRRMMGLDQLRIMGDVECQRIHDQGELAILIRQFETVHADLRDQLQDLVTLTQDLNRLVTRSLT